MGNKLTREQEADLIIEKLKYTKQQIIQKRQDKVEEELIASMAAIIQQEIDDEIVAEMKKIADGYPKRKK